MPKSETEKILANFPYGISFSELESLLLFAENASVTATANKRSREAGSVTRHLNDLDSFFGCALRVRSGKKTVISPQGQELVSLVRRHLQELSDFRDRNSKSLNAVSLAAGDSLLHVLVLPQLHKIQSLFSRTTISVSAARTFEIIEGLEDFTLDLGLLRRSSLPLKGKQKAGEPLAFEEIGDYGYAVFIPKNLWQKIGEDDAKVFDLPFVMIKHHWDTNFLQLAKDNNINFNDVRVICENFIQVFHLVRMGEYAGILPLFCRPLLRHAECRETEFLRTQQHKG